MYSIKIGVNFPLLRGNGVGRDRTGSLLGSKSLRFSPMRLFSASPRSLMRRAVHHTDPTVQKASLGFDLNTQSLVDNAFSWSRVMWTRNSHFFDDFLVGRHCSDRMNSFEKG